jgi:putative salt-induced outer membrane protein YdiY
MAALVVAMLAVLAAGGSAHANEPEDVTLVTGDRLSGTVVERTADHIVLEHSVLGRLEIPVDQLATIDGEEADAALPGIPMKEEEPAPEIQPEKVWKSSFEFSGSFIFGNTDDQGFTIGLGTGRETKRNRTTFDATYSFKQKDGDLDDAKLVAWARNDWLIEDSKWFFFAQGRFDYDAFESWEYRAGIHGGPGYEFINTDDLRFAARIGGGGTKEWKSINEDFVPELLLGGNFRWTISETQNLSASTQFFPNLDETSEFRLVSSVRWNMLVRPESNMQLTASLENEYQSLVDPGNKHNDLRIRVGLRFDF